MISCSAPFDISLLCYFLLNLYTELKFGTELKWINPKEVIYCYYRLWLNISVHIIIHISVHIIIYTSYYRLWLNLN